MKQVEDFDEDALEAHYDPSPDNANLKILPPYIFLIFFLGGLVLEIFAGVDLFRWQVQVILGLLLIGFSFIFFSWALHVLQEAGTPLTPDEPTNVIVENGPYAFSRNPIYLSFAMFYLGFMVLFDVVWGMILFVPMIYCVIKFVIQPEEVYLARKFKSDYAEYKVHVRRWM